MASITLDELTAHAAPLSLLAPVDALLSSFPAVQLTEELAKRFLHGQRIALGKEEVAVPAEPGRVRVYHDSQAAGHWPVAGIQHPGAGALDRHGASISHSNVTLPSDTLLTSVAFLNKSSPTAGAASIFK